jgi:hypothetical protein
MTNRLLPSIPKELLSKWDKAWHTIVTPTDSRPYLEYMYDQCAQWGADQELEACCSIALTEPCCGTKHQRRQLVSRMRELRRPKPPSLKLQALTAMLHLQKAAETNMDTIEAVHIICRALETLPND